MNEKELLENDDIFSRVLKAGRRTYFFDVKETKAGDYYLTITESKKFSYEDGSHEYKKHKIYLYKEDFEAFKSFLNESITFIVNEKGQEVISDRHQKDFKRETEAKREKSSDSFTEVDFEDI
jgi:hypothetical protein